MQGRNMWLNEYESDSVVVTDSKSEFPRSSCGTLN